MSIPNKIIPKYIDRSFFDPSNTLKSDSSSTAGKTSFPLTKVGNANIETQPRTLTCNSTDAAITGSAVSLLAGTGTLMAALAGLPGLTVMTGGIAFGSSCLVSLGLVAASACCSAEINGDDADEPIQAKLEGNVSNPDLTEEEFTPSPLLASKVVFSSTSHLLDDGDDEDQTKRPL